MPPHPFDKQWHVHADSKTHGPYTGHEIRRLVGQGQIEEFDLVYADDGSDWVEARSDPILATLFQRKSAASLQRKPPGYLTPKLRLSLKGALVALLIIIFAWVAWPYYALYDLVAALRTGDAAALENRISWESVRQGLRGDLNAILLQKLSTDSSAGTGLAIVLGPAIINHLVDGYVTPQAVANLIRTGKPTTDVTTREATGVIAAPDPRRDLGFDQVKYAFFFGGPLTFKAEIIPARDQPQQDPITLILRWRGDWRLERILFSASAFDSTLTKPSTPVRTGIPPVTPKEPAPLQVTLDDKGFKLADYKASDYEENITLRLSIKNLTGKNIRAFDGMLKFTDLLDNHVMSISLVVNDLVVADTTLFWSGSIKYNQFIDDHQRLRNADLANLKILFVPRKFLFADGIVKEY